VITMALTKPSWTALQPRLERSTRPKAHRQPATASGSSFLKRQSHVRGLLRDYAVLARQTAGGNRERSRPCSTCAMSRIETGFLFGSSLPAARQYRGRRPQHDLVPRPHGRHLCAFGLALLFSRGSNESPEPHLVAAAAGPDASAFFCRRSSLCGLPRAARFGWHPGAPNDDGAVFRQGVQAGHSARTCCFCAVRTLDNHWSPCFTVVYLSGVRNDQWTRRSLQRHRRRAGLQHQTAVSSRAGPLLLTGLGLPFCYGDLFLCRRHRSRLGA